MSFSPTKRVLPLLAAGLLAGSALLPSAASAAGTPTSQCSIDNLPAWDNLRAFVKAQGGGDPGTRPCQTATNDTGDLVQEWGSGTAYWRKSSGYTVFTNGGTHWAMCPMTDPGKDRIGMPRRIADPANHCSPTGSDGYVWSSADIDPPPGLPTVGQQKQAATAAANPYKDWSVEQLRARLVDLEAQLDSYSSYAQCGIFQPGDSYADYQACVQENLFTNLAQSRGLQFQIVELNAELLRRSFQT